MSKYTKTMSEVLAEMSEGFSKKEIKMAIGVASDPRYKGGNYTGAFKAIEKIKKGLASHPQVAAVLKRQNTSFDPEIAEAGHDDVASAKNQVKVAMSALQKMETELGKLKDEDALPTWWTNKVAIAVDKLDGMADYLDTQVEEVELDEQFDFVLLDKDNKIVARASGKNAKKEMESSKKSAHLPPMRIPKNEVGKMKIVPINPKDKKGIGDMVLAIGEETVVESWELDEGMKMNDPKLLKMFDKLKKGDKIKLKTSSTISQGKDFVEYIVKSKNTVNKGKVEKITLATVGNEKAVKKYLYKRDGTVGFAIGDMGASIDDIKESTNEVPENMAAYLAAITKQLGEK